MNLSLSSIECISGAKGVRFIQFQPDADGLTLVAKFEDGTWTAFKRVVNQGERQPLDVSSDYMQEMLSELHLAFYRAEIGLDKPIAKETHKGYTVGASVAHARDSRKGSIVEVKDGRARVAWPETNWKGKETVRRTWVRFADLRLI